MHLIDTALRAGRARWARCRCPSCRRSRAARSRASSTPSGREVDEQWLGRRVVAHLGPASGGYAELAVRETEALHAMPDGLADDAAVAMIGTGRTALAVLEVAQLTDARTWSS